MIAFGFTDLHVEELRTHLKKNLFKLMLTEGSKVHEPKLVDLASSIDATDGDGSKAGAKANAAAKTNAKPKKRSRNDGADGGKNIQEGSVEEVSPIACQ